MLPLLDALLAGQEQALNAATAARTEAEAELDKLQQTLGRAEQAEKLRLELTAAQARQDALPPGTPPPLRTPELKSAAPPSGSWTEN